MDYKHNALYQLGSPLKRMRATTQDEFDVIIFSFGIFIGKQILYEKIYEKAYMWLIFRDLVNFLVKNKKFISQENYRRVKGYFILTACKENLTEIKKYYKKLYGTPIDEKLLQDLSENFLIKRPIIY